MKKPRKPPKPVRAWAPMSVAAQIAQHKAQVAGMRKAIVRQHHALVAAQQHFTPVPVAVQVKRHAAAVKAAKNRKWSPGADVALCAVRAVAAAAGADLADDELAAAYFTLTADPDGGVTIADAVTLLGGRLRMPVLGISYPQPHAVAVAPDGRWWSWGQLREPWTDDADEVWTPW